MQLQYSIRCFTLHLLLFMVAYNLGNPSLVNGKRNVEEMMAKLGKQSSPRKLTILYSFFTNNDLKVGNTMSLYLGGMYHSNKMPSFLPKEQAQAIPFSSSKLPLVLNLLGFSTNSPQEKAMKETLELCEAEATVHEVVKICATSKEAMLDFVGHAFKLSDHDTQSSSFRALRTTTLNSQQDYDSNNKLSLQNYTIIDEPREIQGAPRMVGCHMLPYPYAIYYCHYLHGENKMFEILIRGENGVEAKAVTVCHMDTSHLDPNHLVYDFLQIKPGEASICHVFPFEDLIWLPPLNQGTISVI